MLTQTAIAQILSANEFLAPMPDEGIHLAARIPKDTDRYSYLCTGIDDHEPEVAIRISTDDLVVYVAYGARLSQVATLHLATATAGELEIAITTALATLDALA